MKRALVVVDMIEDFVREGGALYCGPSMARILPVIQREIARSRDAKEPVVYLTDNHLPGDAEFQIFPPHALVGTKGAEIVPELTPAKDDVVIPKRRYSGFFGTDLDITLRERGVDTLRLVGDCTWPATTPFSTTASYFPAPVVTLRTLKSDVVVGIDEASNTS